MVRQCRIKKIGVIVEKVMGGGTIPHGTGLTSLLRSG